MEIVCLGLSHKTAPIDVREKFAIGETHLGEVAAALSKSEGLREAVVVSTCNRVEYYVAAEDGAAALRLVEEFAAARAQRVAGDAFFRLRGAEGIRHLFRVASGLDSMVLGETEILGQVKKAYAAAQGGGATSRCLNKMFQRAFNVAKEVRTQTGITRGAVSVGSVAVELAEKIFGKLEHCNVMILGAGETAEMTARSLQSRGAKAILVSNRTYERAALLAETLDGKAIHFEQWDAEFSGIDILIGSTGAPHAVVPKAKLAPLMKRRADRPLFCIDLAVPRDFEPTVNDLDGVYLYDIDSLQEIADDGLRVRHSELMHCEQMIERHVEDFAKWLVKPVPLHGEMPQRE